MYKNQIWREGSRRRCNHLFQILSKLVEGFPSCEGPKMGVFHWLWPSPLQQVSTTVLPVMICDCSWWRRHLLWLKVVRIKQITASIAVIRRTIVLNNSACQNMALTIKGSATVCHCSVSRVIYLHFVILNEEQVRCQARKTTDAIIQYSTIQYENLHT